MSPGYRDLAIARTRKHNLGGRARNRGRVSVSKFRISGIPNSPMKPRASCPWSTAWAGLRLDLRPKCLPPNLTCPRSLVPRRQTEGAGYLPHNSVTGDVSKASFQTSRSPLHPSPHRPLFSLRHPLPAPVLIFLTPLQA